VFVSRPGDLEAAERAVAAEWSESLEELGLTPVELSRDEYRLPPGAQLCSRVESCQGLVVLGFRRTPTPWNQIEAGLGLMAGLPVLVAAEDGVSDGVFERAVWGDRVSGVGLRAWEGNEPALQAWLEAVRTAR
jgi:hypothetical protein